jgi:hypothetical protein
VRQLVFCGKGPLSYIPVKHKGVLTKGRLFLEKYCTLKVSSVL